MTAGTPPIRARKLRYYEDANFTKRVLTPPKTSLTGPVADAPNDWTGITASVSAALASEVDAVMRAAKAGPADKEREPTLTIAAAEKEPSRDDADALLDRDDDIDPHPKPMTPVQREHLLGDVARPDSGPGLGKEFDR